MTENKDNVAVYSEVKEDMDFKIKDLKTNKEITKDDIVNLKTRDRVYARKYAKEYYHRHKDEIRKKLSSRVQCVCGKKVTKHGLKAHVKKKLHLSRMDKIKNGEIVLLDPEELKKC